MMRVEHDLGVGQGHYVEKQERKRCFFEKNKKFLRFSRAVRGATVAKGSVLTLDEFLRHVHTELPQRS
jgi:hypothetical protein